MELLGPLVTLVLHDLITDWLILAPPSTVLLFFMDGKQQLQKIY